MDAENTVTRLLGAWRTGDEGVLDELMPLVYNELHVIAQHYMRGERPDHTLQPTALVHEAFLRLGGVSVAWQDRVHFFALAASTMRRVLVDHAKARSREKRGGGVAHLPIEDARHVPSEAPADVVALDESLRRLTVLDERKGRVIELHYFGGLGYDEIAVALDVSAATVDRDLRFAKAWLHNDLREGGGA
jgi:RNA polymerase sigma factor (TIGR02999 family)